MPTFLSDPPPALYFALGLVALIAFGVWYRYRKRAALIAVVGSVLLLVALVLIGQLFESPREQAVRRVNDMAEAINTQNWAKFAEHVSADFDYKGLKKDGLKKGFDLASQYKVRASVWEFDREPGDGPTVSLRFEAKATLPTGEPLLKHFKAVFAKDTDGQYRMKTFTPYNYVQKQSEEPLPGVP